MPPVPAPSRYGATCRAIRSNSASVNGICLQNICWNGVGFTYANTFSVNRRRNSRLLQFARRRACRAVTDKGPTRRGLCLTRGQKRRKRLEPAKGLRAFCCSRACREPDNPDRPRFRAPLARTGQQSRSARSLRRPCQACTVIPCFACQWPSAPGDTSQHLGPGPVRLPSSVRSALRGRDRARGLHAAVLRAASRCLAALRCAAAVPALAARQPHFIHTTVLRAGLRGFAALRRATLISALAAGGRCFGRARLRRGRAGHGRRWRRTRGRQNTRKQQCAEQREHRFHCSAPLGRWAASRSSGGGARERPPAQARAAP